MSKIAKDCLNNFRFLGKINDCQRSLNRDFWESLTKRPILFRIIDFGLDRLDEKQSLDFAMHQKCQLKN